MQEQPFGLAKVISRYTELTGSGNKWSGMCPFCDYEKVAFGVNPVEGVFFCFACARSGDERTFHAILEDMNMEDRPAGPVASGTPLEPDSEVVVTLNSSAERIEFSMDGEIILSTTIPGALGLVGAISHLVDHHAKSLGITTPRGHATHRPRRSRRR